MKILYLPQAVERFLREYQKQVCNSFILDVGCGTGCYTNFFTGNNNNVVGLDIQKHISTEEQKFIFISGNACNLPFLDNTFDLIISFDVVEHIDDDQKMAQEIYRVLKKDGRILIGTPNRRRLANRIKSVLGSPIKYPYKLGYDSNLGGDIIHLREYTSLEIEELFRTCGFKNIIPYSIWLGIPPFLGFLNVPKDFLQIAQYLFLEARK